MDEVQLQRIEHYISGTMSPEEAQVFEQELETNDELQRELALAIQINHHLSNTDNSNSVPQNEYTDRLRKALRSEENKELQNTIKKIGAEHSVKNGGPNKINYLWIASIAAIFIIAIGLVFYSLDPLNDMYGDYYSVNDLPSIVKRNSNQTTLENGVIAFQNDEFTQALGYFETYKSSQDTIDYAVYLYAGMAQLELGDLGKSIANFDEIISSNSLDASKGLWFKALAYLRMSKEEEAKTILNQIVADDSNFKYSSAKELLQKLD